MTQCNLEMFECYQIIRIYNEDLFSFDFTCFTLKLRKDYGQFGYIQIVAQFGQIFVNSKDHENFHCLHCFQLSNCSMINDLTIACVNAEQSGFIFGTY